MNIIVAYDIANPSRLNRIAKVIKDYGVRVQKSMFEITVDHTSFSEMKARVEKIIESSENGVKYFPICEKRSGKLEIIGEGIFVDPNKEYYLL